MDDEEPDYEKFKFFSGYLTVTDPLDFEEKKIIVPVPFLRHQLRYIYDENGKLLTTTFGDGNKDVVVGQTFKLDIEPGIIPDITPGGEYKVLGYTRAGPALRHDYDTRRITSDILGGRYKRKRSTKRRKRHTKSKRRKNRRTRRHRKH